MEPLYSWAHNRPLAFEMENKSIQTYQLKEVGAIRDEMGWMI
jgi:hypothetical protein